MCTCSVLGSVAYACDVHAGGWGASCVLTVGSAGATCSEGVGVTVEGESTCPTVEVIRHLIVSSFS